MPKLEKILDKPEVSKFFWDLLINLEYESGRGILLIATAHVDEQLRSLILAVLPKTTNKSFKKKLFNYPGPLGSFSAKIEMCYAFRLIEKRVYDCLHALRKLRNDAAHSPNKLELHELKEQLIKAYDLGPDIPNFINSIAMRHMLDDKFELSREVLKKFN